MLPNLTRHCSSSRGVTRPPYQQVSISTTDPARRSRSQRGKGINELHGYGLGIANRAGARSARFRYRMRLFKPLLALASLSLLTVMCVNAKDQVPPPGRLVLP